MTGTAGPSPRGKSRGLDIRPLPIRYSGNGFRYVPLEKTLLDIERFFLETGLEVQFQILRRASDESIRAVLEYLSPAGSTKDERYFGKGASEGQALASACLEFVERQCSKMSEDDVLTEASFSEIESEARDPRTFGLDPAKGFHPVMKIDWVWGQSLTRSEPVLVPANLVFFPYEADRSEKFIAWTDSNGLGSGNTFEEAVLHAILEVVERDAVVICEYNESPLSGLSLDGGPLEILKMVEQLAANGYRCTFKASMTDIEIPVFAAFLRHTKEPDNCSVAVGCHLDPAIALSRALTEAVQLLPPAFNHGEWVRSGSPRRYEKRTGIPISFHDFMNPVPSDFRMAIETCVEALSRVGSEVIVVDLILPDIPFPTVRVLATGLQPLLHEGDMRFSRRFFEVPVILGHHCRSADPGRVRIWPIVGYR